jgi:8-oxo-dGTP pyrophosphatase MutT (NUDIX family)
MHTLVTARSIILDPEGRMLILKRSQSDPLAPGTWDLPGGRAEDGESPEQVAARETAEETGFELHDPSLFFATSDIRDGVSKTWLFFTGSVQEHAEPVLSSEHDGYEWIDPKTLDKRTSYDILLRLHEHMQRISIP